MPNLTLNVAIIFLMIVRCISPRNDHVIWTGPLNLLLMNIYYATYPPDEHHLERIKKMWDKHIPQLSYMDTQKLENQIYDLKHYFEKQWRNRSGTERDQMEESLANIYKYTNDGRPRHEQRILEELLKIRPDYYNEYEQIRTVVYQWYKRFTPLGKEIIARHMDWTPQRKADLMHIEEQVKKGKGQKYARVKERWTRMYENLNINEKTLADYAYKLRKKYKYEPSVEEKLIAEQKYKNLFSSEVDRIRNEVSVQSGKKVRWTDEMNADIMHINNDVRRSGVNIAAAIKDRWDRMQKNLTHLTREALLAQINQLNRMRYEPEPKSVQDAKRRYEALPPIPPEVLSKKTGKRKGQQLEIREGKILSREHQNDPFSPGFELTPEQMSLFQQYMEEINGTYAGHHHDPHHIFYYGSSSHTPIDQGSFGSLSDTLHPQQHQRYPGESSSHIFTDQASSSTQPHFPNPYDHQWHPSSSSNYTQHPFQ